jgi:hypothetical protein
MNKDHIRVLNRHKNESSFENPPPLAVGSYIPKPLHKDPGNSCKGLFGFLQGGGGTGIFDIMSQSA